MANRQFYSPLRYPGGKAKLISFMKLFYESNNLMGNTYIEPYTGGGAVALSLLIDGYAKNIIINDVDRSIFAFWHSILNNTDEFCKLISDTPINIQTWKNLKELQTQKQSVDLLKLGFSTFYLNRTNRSGIIKAGLIGGVEQSGDWKMDVRFNKNDLIKRIQNIAKYKSKISLYNLDTIELIDLLINNDKFENSFTYFDPPYYSKGKELYVNFYNHQDHVDLFYRIDSLNDINWLLSYDNNPEIIDLYSDYKKITYNLTYSVEKKYQGSEVIIYSDNLTLPMKENTLKNIQRFKRRLIA